MSRQTCENGGPGSKKTRSSNVPERGHAGSTRWFLTVTSSRVKCQAGKSTIGVGPSDCLGAADAAIGIAVRAIAAATARIAKVPRLELPNAITAGLLSIPGVHES